MNRPSIVCLLAVFLGLSVPADARPPVRAMMKLEVETRIQLRCDDHLMGELRRHDGRFHPEEVVAYAFADDSVKGTVVSAPGAAVRGHGVWYHAEYHCQTSADGLDIEAYNYRLGVPVPRDEWEQHGLVPR
jgi:hypothetical protein